MTTNGAESKAPSPETKLKKLNMWLKIIAIGNCVLGVLAFVQAIPLYFVTERAFQSTGTNTISIEGYDYMIKAMRAVMLGIVPILGAILIVTGIGSLQYLRHRKKIEEGKPNE